MRKVAYCAAGTFVSVTIPEPEYLAFTADHDDTTADDDMRAPCAVLEQVVNRVREGGEAAVGRDEMQAACRIWQFCNRTSETGDDVVVVDYVGDGKSVEFAPLAELPCCADAATCECLRERAEAVR